MTKKIIDLLSVSLKHSVLVLFFAGVHVENAYSYGLGISPYPLPEKLSVMTTEVTGLVSDGRGMGMQARFTHKVSPIVQVEGGFGFSDGERPNRLFVNSDMEIFPDYGAQPRVVLKGFIESAKEDGTRRTILGFTPMLSKEINAWGKSIHPFLGFPVGLTLNRSNQTYQLRTLASVGIAGLLPFGNIQNLLYNLEGNINIQNSFSIIYFGFSYPIN